MSVLRHADHRHALLDDAGEVLVEPETAVQEKDKVAAEEGYRVFTSEIDAAVAKGVVQKNTAARKKSRLSKVLAALQ